ncbi:DDE-type integrase/transposase/recombinase [Streptomyces sp. ISL-98]|uniref:DDE-type integrase/transposase/recombinase n=1 Tax=Streptomyces sp. ISL-98 TaxID=2819192 RepID=UPI001BE5CBB5|nr:DDE-type integrase/transposase/recombinase [Streptomyces sp. ISL-98]MBT2508517.1 DDE-type integrase/transposase/recombinase [Streptomyces sp. ISL-98]
MSGPGVFTPGQVRLGDRVMWQGVAHQVVAFHGPAAVLLAEETSTPVEVLYAAMVSAPGFAVLDGDNSPVAPAPMPAVDDPPSKAQRKQAARWHRHMKELDTGVLPGSSEARPGYEPGVTTLAERYACKSRELAAAGIEISAKTLESMRLKWKRAGENPLVLIERRSRESGHRTDPRVIEIMRDVVMAHSRGSGVDIQTIWEEVLDVVQERFKAELEDPQEAQRLLLKRATFYRRMEDTGLAEYLAAPTRRRAQRASKPLPPYRPSHALRPGEVVQIDTSPLKVKALGDDAQVVSAELTSAIDVASRSNCAVMVVPVVTGEGSPGKRIGGRATRAFDLVLLLAQCFAPLAWRPHWDPLALAANSALPFEDLREADERFARAVAARPVIHPRTVIIDQGSPYLSDHFKYVCDMLGITIQYARKNTPTDKPLKERFFRTLGSRFSQHVAGWTGTGFAHRGLGIDKGPLYPINTLQDLAEQWIALDYQQTPHKGLRSPFTPGLILSPNEMYAQLMPMTGYRPRPITAEEARKLLVPAWVEISDKGITIENRTYQGADWRMRLLIEQRSGITEHNDRFEARYNPYHPEVAYLFDHVYSQEWVEVEFIHRGLLDDRWTQDLWERATAMVVDDGGRKDDQLAIVKALRALRRSLRQGPGKAQKSAPKIPFQGLEVAAEPEPVVNPYAGVSIDIEAVAAYPSLPVAGRESDRPPAADSTNSP